MIPAAARRFDSLAVLAVLAALFAAQAWYSSLTATRLLDEELYESVRNPVWVAHRLIYDGVSGNVGWYALVGAAWQVFGFSLFTGKILRIIFHVVSLLCLAHLLVRWLGCRRALLPLAVIGTSPALLYLNTFGTTYGIDLQWTPVLLWLLWRATESNGGRPVAHALLGLGVTAAALMWPVCLFYVPLWGLLYALRSRAWRPQALCAALVFAALPLLGVLAWLDNAGTWLHDPSTGSGAFRGGGAGFVSTPRAFAANLWWMARDMTTSGSSYYFWLARPDVAGVLGWIPAAVMAGMLPGVWRSRPELRKPLGAALVLALVAIMLAAAAGGPPGFRRATLALAVFYAIYVVCWQTAIGNARGAGNIWQPKVQTALLSLLLVHHALALLPNARSLKADVPPIERHWLRVGPTPAESVARVAETVSGGHPLDCRAVALDAGSCRYAEIYSAVEGYLRWSRGQRMPPVRAYDFGTGRFVALEPETWPFGSRR